MPTVTSLPGGGPAHQSGSLANEGPGSDPTPAETAPSRRADRHRGQALVEFAIVLPVFFLLVAGMFDFGLGIYSDLTLVNAAREGARLGTIDPGNTSAIEARVRAMADNLDRRPSSMSRSTASAPPAAPSRPAPTPSGSPAMRPGSRSSYDYTTFFPLLFGTEIPLASEARMRIE